MKNKLNIDSLYRPIANFGNIGLEHRVNLFEPSKVSGEKNVPYRKDFVSTKSKGGIIGFKSVAFRNTRDSIILKGVSFSKDDIKRVPPSVYLTYSDVSEVKRIFTTASSWFTSDIKNDLFQYENNIPYRVSEKYNELSVVMNCTSGYAGSFLSIQPYVIIDSLNNIGYPGVILKCQQGVLGTCSLTEFMSLGSILIKNLENLYELSIQLMNHFMLQEEV